MYRVNGPELGELAVAEKEASATETSAKEATNTDAINKEARAELLSVHQKLVPESVWANGSEAPEGEASAARLHLRPLSARRMTDEDG